MWYVLLLMLLLGEYSFQSQVLPNSNFRSHCGLATSTRKVGISLWGDNARGAPPSHTSPEQRARMLFGAANPPYSDYVFGASASIGLMIPGVNRLDFDGEYWPKTIGPLLSDECIDWLEHVLWLVPLFESTAPP